jgi:hypothetical protein
MISTSLRKFKYILVSTLLVATLLFAPIHQAKAAVWGEAMASQVWKYGMEQLTTYVQGMIRGALKAAYAAAVVTKIHHQLVGLSNQRSGRKSANLYE